MTEVDDRAAAGRLLREAREKQGLHIAALAASIKVPPKKLEALESGRVGDLPDATFARALAQTVCRALKIDAAPVLALLPPPSGHRLEQVSEGLNTPFRERQGELAKADWKGLAASPVLWVTAIVLVAAAAIYLLPARFVEGLAPWRSASAPREGTSLVREPATTVGDARSTGEGGPTVPVVDAAASAPPGATPIADAGSGVASSSGAVAPVESGPSGVAAGSTSADASTAGPGLLRLRTTADSWVEVTDARGAALLSRLVRGGETVDLDGQPPFRLRVGNAAATQVTWRGKPADVVSSTRDNVARFELR